MTSSRITIRTLVLAGILASPSAAYAQARPTPADAPAQAPKLTKPPRVVKFVEAEHPQGENRAATVVLSVTIAATGNVDDVKVAESAGPAFDAAAIAAVKGFVFEPAEIDGKP